METYDCGCFGGPMQMCPTHASAKEMYELIKKAEFIMGWPSHDMEPTRKKLSAFISKVEADRMVKEVK